MLIKELILLTDDIAATKAFYHVLMEFAVLKEEENYISFKTGNSILSFKTTASKTNPFYHIAFSIPNNKLNEAKAWVAKRTAILPYSPTEIIADFTGWNAKAFYFHDSKENILEFITHFDLGTNEQNSFSAASVERICEIGIVTDNVLETCEAVKTKYNIPYFSKGPLLKDFAVMGDSAGMLIVSKTQRGWLPTQRLAEQFSVNAKIEINGNDTELFFR